MSQDTSYQPGFCQLGSRELQSGPGPGPGPGPAGTGTGTGTKILFFTGPGRDRDRSFVFYRDGTGTKFTKWSRKFLSSTRLYIFLSVIFL